MDHHPTDELPLGTDAPVCEDTSEAPMSKPAMDKGASTVIYYTDEAETPPDWTATSCSGCAAKDPHVEDTC